MSICQVEKFSASGVHGTGIANRAPRRADISRPPNLCGRRDAELTAIGDRNIRARCTASAGSSILSVPLRAHFSIR